MANNQLLASDNFLSGSLAAGWSAVSGDSKCQVVTGSPNVTEANALSTDAGQIWTGLAWPNDQSSEATIQTLTSETGTSILTLAVRMQSGSNSGYRANIQNNNSVFSIQAYRYTNGTPTQIINGLVVSIASGDVFTFTASGSCITLYQNGKFLAYAYDATYPSGSPGFTQYTTTNLAHCQVSAWRGYNAVQQDGIWQKSGIAIPAIAGDLSSSTGEVGPQNPTIFLDGNAQLLSGTVYKMWFATTGAVGYAESTDLVNWTRRSPNVLSGSNIGITPFVMKIGNTYHMYEGVTNIVHYTSSDGVSWTSQGTVFTKTGALYFSVLAIINGTWYAMYSNTASDAFPITSGLATSPDGTTWTDYAGNPVVSNFFAIVYAFKDSAGVYHAWGATANPNARETSKPGIDPGEGLRMQSTDFIHWTNPVHSIHCTQLFEGVNEPNGGAYVSFPVAGPDGRAHLFYSAGPDDAILTAASTLQIAYALGPPGVSIAQIVNQPENGMVQLSADSFPGPSFGPNWLTPTGVTALQLVSSGIVEASALNTRCAAYYSGSFGNDQYSEVTVGALTGSNGQDAILPLVRMQASGQNWYQASVLGPTGTLQTTATGVQLSKVVAGTKTAIGPITPITPEVGDVFRLSAVGSNPVVLTLYQNGYVVAQWVDLSNAFTTGFPGMGISETTALAQAQISAWAGGNAGVVPNYTTWRPLVFW